MGLTCGASRKNDGRRTTRLVTHPNTAPTTTMARDDFLSTVKTLLARRVAMRCSNPAHRATTVGPQECGTGSVNLGVACHISAASVGGPRYDDSMSVKERKSAANGIWLCQTCAKLVDSDPGYYSKTLLYDWKADAERRALAELGVKAAASFYPQALSASHTPVPCIAGISYDTARKDLMDAGWQPVMRHWSDADSLDIRWGNGPSFWEKGYREIRHASGTGAAFCTFLFRDMYGNQLVVVTAGEVIEDIAATAHVWSWYLLGEADKT